MRGSRARTLRLGIRRHALARIKLTAYSTCDVQISLDCQKRSATEIFPVKRVELVCVYVACGPCLEWFDTDQRPARTDLEQYLHPPPKLPHL